MRSVELFAGAGGLAMGIALAGFKSLSVIEWDRNACETIRENQRRGFPLVADWPMHEGDVRDIDWTAIPEDIELLAGGPPCQPFSMGGKHGAYEDARDMFPATVQIVRKLRPKAFIIENVKGLTRSSFANYYQYILLQLEFPEVPKGRKETWIEHHARLQVEKTSGNLHGSGLTYNVVPTLVNAADYGIPQKRERVFIVGFRSDLGVEWNFPRPTHGEDALILDQWVSGEYWDRHRVSKIHIPANPAKYAQKIIDLRNLLIPLEVKPWRTVRDALEGLPDPTSRKADEHFDHHFQSGARPYHGHTGSPQDQPAKTLKAGDHGVPGGENMMVAPNGGVRYFTVRESARIQTFPDGFVFKSSWTESMRQLGNAVPVYLARVVASSVAERLIEAQARTIKTKRSVYKGVA